MKLRTFILSFLGVVVFTVFISSTSSVKADNALQEGEPPIQIAILREGNIWLVTMDRDTPDQQITNSGKDCCINWSPDGRTLYFSREIEPRDKHGIFAYSFDSDLESQIDLIDEHIQPPFDITADGQTLFYVFEREISPGPNEALLLGIESCLVSYNLSTQIRQEIDCIRDLSITQVDLSPDDKKFALSRFGFEYVDIAVFDLDTNRIERVGCCINAHFRTNDELIMGESWYLLNELTQVTGDFSLFKLNLLTGSFRKLMGSPVELQASDIVDGGKGMLYSQGNEVLYYIFEFDHPMVMGITGFNPKQRPPVIESEPLLPPEFEIWLREKQQLIDSLDSPPFTVFNIPFTPPEELVPNWGYQEGDAQILLNNLNTDYSKFKKGEMSQEEMEGFILKAQAFGRFYLSEQALDDFYPLYAKTSYNTAESMISIISITVGMIQTVKQITEKLVLENNPFSSVMMKLNRIIERQMLDIADSFLKIMLRTTPDPDLEDNLIFVWNQIYRGVQLRYDEELDTGQVLLDIFLDEGLKSGFAAMLLEDYFLKTQPLINDGVAKMENSHYSSVITGSQENASNHTKNFYSDANLYTNYMSQQHSDFQQAINITELSASFSHLIATVDPTLIMRIVGIVSNVMGEGLSVYDGVCQGDHLNFLRDSVAASHVYAFDAEQPLSWDTPSHCDFSYWPGFSDWFSLDSTTPNDQIVSSDVSPSLIVKTFSLAETQVGDEIGDYQEKLTELEEMIADGDPAQVEDLLESIFMIKDKLSTNLAITIAPYESGIPPEEIRLLQKDILVFDLQTTFLYTTLISYFAEPDNPTIQASVQEQIEQVNTTLDRVSDASIPDTAEIEGDILSVPPLLIAGISVAEWDSLAQMAVFTITVANIGDTTVPAYLSLKNGASLQVNTERINISGQDRDEIILQIRKLKEGSNLFFVQLLDGQRELVESKPVWIDVVFANKGEIKVDFIVEDSSKEFSGTYSLNTSIRRFFNANQQTMVLGISALILLAGIGGGVVLYKRDQKTGAGASAVGGIVLAAGLVFWGTGQSPFAISQAKPIPLSTPISMTSTPANAIAEVDAIGTEIAATAVSLQELLPTPTPPGTATNTPIPTPTAPPTAPPTATPNWTIFEIGNSVHGKPIVAVRLGDGPKTVIVVGGIHAGFAPGSVALAEQLISHYQQNEENIPEDVTLIIVSSLNPDASYAPGRYEGRINANGIDLNRNWDCAWKADTEVLGEVRPGVGGTGPLSEPESRALADLIEETDPEAVIFFEARARNGYVVPGNCGSRHELSERLTTLYSSAASYQAADFTTLSGDVIPGDVSNWLVELDIAAIFSILPEYEGADFSANLNGLMAVLAEISHR